MAASNPDYNIIVQQLERMSTKIDEISKEVQLTNIEMVKLGGMKHVIQDLKTWKENVETAVNAEDLREMKSALSEVKKHTEEIEQFEKEMDHLKREKEKDKEEIDKLKVFKTKIATVGAISFFILTTAITVVGWYLS
jgi:predicted RNase H-like nuclease (RuvC/YqgF family)